MINLTCELLHNLCKAYPLNSKSLNLQPELKYPYGEQGFVLGYTEDCYCIGVMFDTPYIEDDTFFNKVFTTKIISRPYTKIIVLSQASHYDPVRHQIFYGASLSDIIDNSIGFRMPPHIHTRVLLSTCNISNNNIADLSNHPHGLFLEISRARPEPVAFNYPIARNKLVESISGAEASKLLKRKGNANPSRHRYADIQCYLEDYLPIQDKNLASSKIAI